MAIAGNNQAFENPHKVYHMLNIRTGNATIARLDNDNNNNHNQCQNNQNNNDNCRQRDNGNNHYGNEQDNGNGNCRPNNDTDRNVRQRQDGDSMTDERKAVLKEQGFLQKSGGRFVTFVHEFSSFNDNAMCQFFCYKGFFCKQSDEGVCRFAHITSYHRLPTREKNAVKTWVDNTPNVTFVEGRGPSISGS